MAHPPNYRERYANTPYRYCRSCKFYDSQEGGLCRKFRVSVFPDHVCDDWEWEGRTAAQYQRAGTT